MLLLILSNASYWTNSPTQTVQQCLFACEIVVQRKQLDEYWKLVRCQLDWRRILDCSSLTSGKLDECVFVFTISIAEFVNLLNILDARTWQRTSRGRGREIASEGMKERKGIKMQWKSVETSNLFHQSSLICFCIVFDVRCHSFDLANETYPILIFFVFFCGRKDTNWMRNYPQEISTFHSITATWEFGSVLKKQLRKRAD